jgi:hypothetical protein
MLDIYKGVERDRFSLYCGNSSCPAAVVSRIYIKEKRKERKASAVMSWILFIIYAPPVFVLTH